MNGPSLSVDRIWLIRSDGTQATSIHPRLSQAETLVHEFWSKDGRSIWYDLQETKKTSFGIGKYDIATGRTVAYSLHKDDASVHYNAASNGSFFCGDGNTPAHSDTPDAHGHPLVNRQWIEALYPEPGNGGTLSGSQVIGSLRSDHLADLTNHNYLTLEPNVRFSPDNRLVFYNANIFGVSYLFAVEVQAAK